jgi:hypothetical protein
MGTNAAIDVAIALILMYLVLSLIVTVANEQIATALDLRAVTLKSALTQLIDHDPLRGEFENHGLIAGVNAAVSVDKSSVVFRLLARLCQMIWRFQKAPDGPHPSYLSGKTFALALLGSLDPTKPVLLYTDIENAIRQMPDCNIRDTLLAQLATANKDIEKLRDNIAAWFDSAMDRVSGVYKRNLKRISFTVGLLLVLAVNADTVRVSTALWNDASLRAGMVEKASALASDKANAGASDHDAIQKIKEFQSELRPIPLGWSYAAIPASLTPSLAWAFISKIVGLLLTAFAISLGAPFWFDLLGMFVHIRGTGDKPEKISSTP